MPPDIYYLYNLIKEKWKRLKHRSKNILVGNPEERPILEKSRRRCEDNIKIGLK